LSNPWNPDDNIEDLWLRISTAQELAHCAGEDILDPVTIRLTIDALEASGVFDFALDNWRLKDNATKTLDTFKAHFNKEDNKCKRKLTAKTGGYHGANSADGNRPRDTPPPNPTPTSGSVVLPNGVKMYYCWSHGLGINKQHTPLEVSTTSETVRNELSNQSICQPVSSTSLDTSTGPPHHLHHCRHW
jgi:hypothetical protein